MPLKTPAAQLPVVRVLPLLKVSHLDRGFDYLVSEEDSDAAQPGVRVRIRFHGQLQDALVLQRLEQSDFSGKLSFIDRVISPAVVYPQCLAQLIESLAQRYGGTRPDIIRSAIPPRHAKAEEGDFLKPWPELGAIEEPDLSGWSAYQHGESFVDSVLEGKVARAAWQILPGTQWCADVAALAVKVAQAGGGVVIVVPHQRDLEQMERALRAVVSAKQVTVLTNALGPSARYRRYLSVIMGQARIVIGTRSAAFAPVQNLKLAVIFNDGDSNLVDNLKPYVHAREVLTTRSALEGCSLIMANYARTAEVQLLVESGWAHDLAASPAVVSKRMPAMRAVGNYGVQFAREENSSNALSGQAYKALKLALAAGKPVVVQVQRKGFAPALACGQCRTPARCRQCNGPLGLPSVHGGAEAALPSCAWCGRVEAQFRCSSCGSTRMRAQVLGSEKIAHEIGKTFPSTKVIVSGGNRVIDEIPPEPAVVVCTAGSHPRIMGGGLYGAALVLDAQWQLSRQDLRATEQAFASWMALAAVVDKADDGGVFVLAAEQEVEVVEECLSWNVVGASRRELAARRAVGFPPAVALAAIDGPARALEDFLKAVELPEGSQVLGPVPLPPGVRLPGEYDEQKFGSLERILLRCPPGPRARLGTALREAQAQRSVRKEDLPLRVQVDPMDIG